MALSRGGIVLIVPKLVAYAEANRYERRVTASERGCKLATSLGQTNLLERNQEMLEQFKKREPYRERN